VNKNNFNYAKVNFKLRICYIITITTIIMCILMNNDLILIMCMYVCVCVCKNNLKGSTIDNYKQLNVLPVEKLYLKK